MNRQERNVGGVKISDRLISVAQMVTPGRRVADIGTDHGYVPIYLMKHGLAEYVIAMDVREGPLAKARENIRLSGCKDVIELRLSDGFEKLQSGEVQSVCISGMGGGLMKRLLLDGRPVTESVEEFVLSPHSEIALVRAYIHEMGHKIIGEKMLKDDGKYYTILKTARGSESAYSKQEYRYGRRLLERRDPVLMAYLEEQKRKQGLILENLNKNGSPASKERYAQVAREIAEIESLQG